MATATAFSEEVGVKQLEIETTSRAKASLVYNGTEQSLLAALGTVKDDKGTMQYYVSEDDSTLPEGAAFTADEPKETNAGTYYAWYKAEESTDHDYPETKAVCLPVTIAKADGAVTAKPTAATNLKYTGSPQALLTAAGSGTGTMLFSLEKEGNYTEDISAIVGTDAGKYTVWYRSAESINYQASDAAYIEVTIAEAASSGSGSSRVQKPTISFDTADVTAMTQSDGSTIYATSEGRLVLSKDGKTASIEASEGYEVASVSVNGAEKGAVTALTALRTGDKVEVSFKHTADAQKKAEIAKLNALLEKLSLTARSSKTGKGNIKVSLKMNEEASTAISELKELGYSVKYKFYRSMKKSSSYKSMLTKSGKTYNTNGKAGARYYYKVQVRIYDENGKCVAKTALKQCKYATRIWTK